MNRMILSKQSQIYLLVVNQVEDLLSKFSNNIRNDSLFNLSL